MKWGVRRYQNKDGTLNSAGKKRVANKANKKPLTEKEKQSRNKKLMKKGTSVAVGLLGGAFGAINVYTITGSPMAVAILAPTIGSLMSMRYDKMVEE